MTAPVAQAWGLCGEAHEGTLMEVDWDPETRSWAVYARPSSGTPWSAFEGAQGELEDLLALAHAVVAGG